MANVPFPISGEGIEDIRYQIHELIRVLYEEKIGGADLGDVFSIVGDVLTLVLAGSSGLTKTGNVLAVDPTSTGGLQVTTDGLIIKILSTGGLETSASGEGVKLDGTSLTLSASGLKLNAALLDWGGMTASRLVATGASEEIVSVANLASWIAGTASVLTVTNDGDGSVTLDIADAYGETIEAQSYFMSLGL